MEKYAQGHSYKQFSKAAGCTGSPSAQGTADEVNITKIKESFATSLGFSTS